jgi:hypothetical protein
MMKKLIAAIAALTIAGCGAPSPSGDATASNESQPAQAQTGEVAKPGEQNVSTTEAGQPFWAEPNFYYYEGCGHPCDLAVYPSSNPASGTVSITDTFPLEASEDKEADKVWVVCQVTDGKQAANDTGAYSRVWNYVRIPYEHLTVDAIADLPQDHGGFGYGYAPDIWMGNTGDHKLPC